MLVFQLTSLDRIGQSGTGACFVIASTDAERDQILDTLDLRPAYDAIRAERRDHAVIPGTRLTAIANRLHRDVADRITPDPIGALFAGRYQHSLQMAAERVTLGRNDILILREIDPDGGFAFANAPRKGMPVLVECGGWTCAAHLADPQDPECRPDGWATDNGWVGMTWPPTCYLPLPALPRL